MSWLVGRHSLAATQLDAHDKGAFFLARHRQEVKVTGDY